MKIDFVYFIWKNFSFLCFFFPKGVASLNQSALSRPMQRKLVTLVNCQLVEEEGRVRAMRAARSLGERTVTELILQHQNPQQLSANLWAAVRARGCQFLGPGRIDHCLVCCTGCQDERMPISGGWWETPDSTHFYLHI